MKEIERKEYEIGALQITEEGFIELISTKENFILEDYKALVIAIADISKGKKLPYLTDERGKQRYMDNESKKFMNDNLHKYVSACAVMEDSAVLRFLVHTFVSIYRPKVPIKMFKSRDDANSWLVKFL
jgi:hypothetical protein